jgi:hypothetical protein
MAEQERKKMSKTNCPNCGAAKDASEIRCPFCGTAYLDMSAIDLYSHEPMWLKFVGPDRKTTYQIKAYPTVANFTVYPGDISCMRDMSGRLVRQTRARNNVRITLEFAGTESDV